MMCPKQGSTLGNSNVRSNLVLVPVPLGNVRRKERGFNQIEEITNRAAKLLGGAPIDASLLRTNPRDHLASLASPTARDRKHARRVQCNAQRQIVVAATYIVIDDVITTGATLQAAIDALTSAGAEHIIPLALAH